LLPAKGHSALVHQIEESVMEKNITELKLEDLQAVAGGTRFATTVVQPQAVSVYGGTASQGLTSTSQQVSSVFR
jgi:hypothetical protein